MSASLNDIVSQMRSALAVTDPDLDTSIGTTTRKMLDAVAESIAESYLDQHMLAYVYDVDSKVEGDLDSFCQAVGGISRLAAKRATGTVTFTRSGPTTTTVFIPVNAQISSNTTPSIPVQTLTGAVMLPGQSTVTVAVQAVNGGPDGNIAANALTLLVTPIESIAVVTNLQPLTGGVSQETDTELRERWKATVFRSNAGSESMYLGLALDDPSVTAAQVLGASRRRREQVQVSAGVAVSTVDDVAYTFPTGVFVGSDIDNGVLLLNGVDYSWDTTVTPPRVVILNTSAVDGTVLDLDFEYTPTASRNDPTGLRFSGSSIMSRVDVLCAGQRPTAAQQSVVFSSTLRFTGDTASVYYTGKFVRLDGTNPTSTNVFLPLAFGPIISVPDVLTVSGATYGRIGAPTIGITYPSAYAVIHEDFPFGYTATSRFGLEWVIASVPANGTVFTIGGNGDYTYNEVPRAVQAQVDRWRLVGVDAKTHAAKQIYLRISLAVMYDRNANHAATNEAIDVALATYLGKIGLSGVVQVSDLEQAAHNVAGVDNVRLLGSQDYLSWTYGSSNSFNLGVQRIVTGTVVETYVTTGGQFKDIVYGDAEVPVFESAIKVVKAQNTFAY